MYIVRRFLGELMESARWKAKAVAGGRLDST